MNYINNQCEPTLGTLTVKLAIKNAHLFKGRCPDSQYRSPMFFSAEIKTLPEKKKKKKEVSKTGKSPTLIPRYNVVLLDDNDHTYDYVVEMLMKLFGHSQATAFKMACIVDFTGRVIVDTTSKERAELKRDQIHAYGADWRIPHCQGSMSAIIEPAE